MESILNMISKGLENHRSLHQNMNDLKRILAVLNALKNDTESRMRTEVRPRKKLKTEVHLWLKNVERVNGEIQNLDKKVMESTAVLRGSYNEYVLRKIQEVQDLLQQGKFDQGLVIDDPQWIGQVLSTANLSRKVAENSLKEIWTYLMRDDVSNIGVWGMGGVGKTTIMKLINNQLLKETEKFNTVIWTTVSKELNIAKLQDDIVRAMNEAPLEDDDVTRRAGMISEKLSLKGKYVLILDDVWANLSLEEVGIPEPTIGSKLVVTTRKLDVCRCLDCREVPVSPLPEEDALSLFLEKVGRDISNDPCLLPIVKSVVEECAGLPLAIVTVACSMKGVCNIEEWSNALDELKRGAKGVNGWDETVLHPLKFSYDRLKDETIKQCFLYCALWPEDYTIDRDELIEFWIVEGLVEETDRGRTILNQLINNCLLVKDGESYVKLHDLVRDMALDITTKGKPRFLVRAGMQLKEIPDLKEWAEDLDKVSLMRNSGMEIPPQMSPPKCPSLTTLLLASCYIRSIPERFFEQMHGLKILDLSKNPIECLPKSISDLENLTALLLEGCDCLKNMPSFSKLLALEKLNLEGTGIRNLPDGMERLVKLKYLNFSRTCITKIPDGILSKFSCLQHLEGGGQVLRGDEIGGLRKLEIFKGRFRDVEELSNYVQALNGQTQGPREYHIVVGGGFADYNTVRFEKRIELINCQICRNDAKFPSDVQYLIIRRCSFEFGEELLFSRLIPVSHPTFSALTFFSIYGCKNIKKLFSSDWVPKNLQNLEVLSVKDCKEMEEIIASSASEGMDSSNTLNLALPKLRGLYLEDLPELKSIYSAKGAMVCDSLLIVDIQYCPKLKKLFSSDWVPTNLQNLECLSVYECDEMEEIIASSASEGMDSSNTLNLALPKLRELRMRGQPELKSIYSAKGAMVCDSLRIVTIFCCPKLKKLFSSDWVLQNLEELRVSSCDEMEEIIASSASEGMDSSNTLNLALPKLTKLSLWGLPELKSIYSAKGAMVCDSLQNVEINRCPKLKKLFSSDWVPKNLQNLKKLWVSNCDEMEEIIASSASEGMDSSNTLNLALPKLRILRMRGLPELKSIYSAKGAMVCDSLQRVSMIRCPKLKRIPLYLPLLEDGRPSPPPSLQEIWMKPKESWENMEWDHPYAKSLLEPFVYFSSS